MAHTRLDENDVARPHHTVLSVQPNVELSRETVERLLFLVVILLRMNLTGENTEKFLAVFPVHHGDHEEPCFTELVKSVMVRDLQIGMLRQRNSGSPEEFPGLLDDSPDGFLFLDQVNIGLQDCTVSRHI